ncbi:hypothetical protein A3K86_18840 [Photobacterium jeanii]|uniref:Uncharacterized protein n=1 Tax=Photobacterium jeanii TaxID=858640 RepID=A0A178K2S2_9GAMM|nr:hypothetical protein [Photobacterium jeanii]OAN11034.1 hypothetical protein A3K86_18840 [Photobacterium jeanii]PST90547.1 hypothetical protein C9I91_07940 [Photobacterium jeanii]
MSNSSSSLLQQALEQVGLPRLALSETQQKQLTDFIENQHTFFERVCEQKRDKHQTDLLLGLLTKAQQQTELAYSQNAEAIQRMQQVFSETIGEEQKSKFISQDHNQLALETHLWLLVQGYCGIDFSYANEQAQRVAELLTSSDEAQALRSQFLASYYHGKTTKDNKQPSEATSSLWQRLERFFGR